MQPIKLDIPPYLIRQFKAKAKAMFPREAYAVLIGEIDKKANLIVHDIEYPDFRSTEFKVCIDYQVLTAINEHSNEEGLRILGDIHSHCYDTSAYVGYSWDRARSEADHYYAPLFLVQGICVIIRTKNKKLLRSSIKYWGPHIPIETAK